MNKIYNSKSTIFFWLLMAFICGVGFASFFSIGGVPLLLALFFSAGLFFCGIIFKQKFLLLASSFFIIFTLGAARVNRAFNSAKINFIFANSKSQVVEGIICEDPDERLGYANLVLQESKSEKRILVRTANYPEYSYGDKIIVEGKFDPASKSDDFSWQGYLMRHELAATVYYPKITVVSKNQGSKALNLIFSLRKLISKKLSASISGAESQFLAALLLGYKNTVSSYWKNVFSRTGTSHIISISGMHISILSGMFLIFLFWLGMPRKWAFWAVFLGLVFYSVFSGCSPSTIRASIMGILVLLASCVGRMPSRRNILAFSAAIMLLANPLILRFDVGFQLSFLSVAGIFYLWPALEKITSNFPNPLQIKSLVSLSLSAQIMTLPVVLLKFKLFSAVAPLANLLIVPFVPLIMILGLAPIALIFLSDNFLRLLFLPAEELTKIILKFLEIFSRLPAVDTSIGWGAACISYVFILFFIFKCNAEFNLIL
ncbi:MAG: ComEC/Rec2 family competence protein [bacterium]